MIDTHTHLSFFEPGDRERQIETAKGLGTRLFVEVAATAENALKVVEFANSRDDVYFGVAVHPWQLDTYESAKDLPLLKKLISENNKAVCVGECGLDYSEANPQVAEGQRQLFREMIRLAREVGLPLNMHTDRQSSRDLVDILREEKAYEVGGMVHNFAGNLDLARELLDLGCYASACVLIHHPRAERLRGVFGDISIGQLVMDSDAPGAKLIRTEDGDEPYPYDMDKYSEPRMLRYICDKLAEVKGMAVEDVEVITALNAARLFGLPREA